MLAKLFFLVALVLFIVIAVGSAINIAWGFAALAAGLLFEGYGPAGPRWP
jgi:hypothetical protein